MIYFVNIQIIGLSDEIIPSL
ncbi:protein of unknown function [Mycoplasma capricolum subsp. capripneumoniae]|nr:protein of unknown function [Mycoplasma capricolum subsp. capripneumoniae]